MIKPSKKEEKLLSKRWMMKLILDTWTIVTIALFVIDFLSGNKILPNKFFEYLGLAWLIRLITEPRRLFWRYFSTNFLFIFFAFLAILIFGFNNYYSAKIITPTLLKSINEPHAVCVSL